MPIGKNSIKRAVNNGYSKVKTTAPDMENSVVVEEKPAVKKASAPKAPAKKPATKKAVAPKKAETAKKVVTVKKAVAPKVATPKVVAPKTAEIKKYQIGEALPIYLL